MDRLVDVGDEVKDQITGFKGIVNARATFLYGCVRVEVQPQKLKSDKTSKEDAVWFDETQLILVKKKVIKGDMHRIPAGYEPGDEAKDRITGFKGVINSYIEYLFGPVRVALVPQKLKDGKTVDGEYFDVSRITLLKKKKITLQEPVKKAIKEKKSTGGPSRESKSAIPAMEKR